jgi:hypothetical protein
MFRLSLNLLLLINNSLKEATHEKFHRQNHQTFLVIAGLGTCGAGLLVFSPQFAVEDMFKLPFVEDYVSSQARRTRPISALLKDLNAIQIAFTYSMVFNLKKNDFNL